MPEIYISQYIDYDVESFFEEMSDSEKSRMFEILNEYFNLTPNEQTMTYTEYEFKKNCQKISNCMYQMSNEEIEYIQKIANKY